MSDDVRRYEVVTADPEGYWLMQRGSTDPSRWAWMEQASPCVEIERLRAELEHALAAESRYAKQLAEKDRRIGEMERLRAEVVLKTAEAEGAGSLLLDVQQECIDLRARVEELEKQLEIAEGERDITLKHYIGAMDKIMGYEACKGE